MVLYYRGGGASSGGGDSGPMDDDAALGIWIAITTDTILLEALLVLGDDGNGLEVRVDSVVLGRDTAEALGLYGGGGARGRGRLRRLQPEEKEEEEEDPASSTSSSVATVATRAADDADPDPPQATLEVSFVAIVEFVSDRDDWDPKSMVAGGFRTQTDREEYVSALSREDTAFDGVERMSLRVDGEVIPEEAAASPASNEVDSGGSDNKSLYYIVGGALGGSLLFIVVGVMFYRAGRHSREKDERVAEVGRRPSSGRWDEREVLGRELDPTTSSAPPLKKTPAIAPPPPQRMQQRPLYPAAARGSSSRKYDEMMIESRGDVDDDISTLGDPYFGEGGSKWVDSPGPSDEAIAEQSVMSAGQEIFVYGTRQRLNTKDGGSTMYTEGDGTRGEGSRRMVFGDDTTLEDAYLNNPYDVVGGSESKDFQRFVVIAPAGALGIVIDNVTGDLPIVHAIRETSVLHGKVCVGDFLISVDEVECRGLSAVQVSRLISGRSENPGRRLALLRASSN